MTERQTAQSAFYEGGDLDGVALYPLTIDRLGVLQEHIFGHEADGAKVTRLALAVYSTPDDELGALDSPEVKQGRRP